MLFMIGYEFKPGKEVIEQLIGHAEIKNKSSSSNGRIKQEKRQLNISPQLLVRLRPSI